jgi:hypothetical protein
MSSSRKYILFIDTCVWLDIAKKAEPVLSVIEELISINKINLIVPSIIKNEFHNNEESIIESTRRKLTQEFKTVRQALQLLGTNKKINAAINIIDEANHKLPLLNDAIFSSVDRINKLFEKSKTIEVNKDLMEIVCLRALNKLAPFHKNKNNVADALLIELFRVNAKKNTDAISFFITYNKNDFSNPIDDRKIHDDYISYFDNITTKYEINLLNAINEIDSNIIDYQIFENESINETRSLMEIIKNTQEFEDKIWYNRHMVIKERVEQGLTTIDKEIWNGALKSAEKVRKRYKNNVGPYDDFEWGMLNGKLSALRWVLGDDWDMLDT